MLSMGGPDPLEHLPLQLTSFVGREHELRELTGLLERSRLLTLTGPGGGGKTRLSLKLAAAVAGGFPDGVFFVALAPVGDPALVLSSIAQGIGLLEVGDRPLADRLHSHLRTARALILLDNARDRPGRLRRSARPAGREHPAEPGAGRPAWRGDGPDLPGPQLDRGQPPRRGAGRLRLSVRTVDTHVDHVLTKLGFSNRSQLVAWAYESGLAPDQPHPRELRREPADPSRPQARRSLARPAGTRPRGHPWWAGDQAPRPAAPRSADNDDRTLATADAG
jgi:hypothetical protein